MPDLQHNKPRPFIDTLRTVEYGHLLDELTEVQHEVVEAVNKTGKQGQITIVLKYKQETEGQIRIEADIKDKVPQQARGGTLFFLTPEGNLDQNDPRQSNLPLRNVNEPQAQNLRKVDES